MQDPEEFFLDFYSHPQGSMRPVEWDGVINDPQENTMLGGYSTGKGLRHRPVPKFYFPSQNEEQWKKMREV